MLRDMTDSKRIDGHVQSQRTVSPLFRPRPGFSYKLCFAVDCPSNNYIAIFLAFIRDQWDGHAWTISTVRVQLLSFSTWVFNDLPIFRSQTDYAHEFTVFKPYKKLKWLPHLGSVQLEVQLEDRGCFYWAIFRKRFAHVPFFILVFYFSVPNCERLLLFSSYLDFGRSDILRRFNWPRCCYQGVIYLGGSWGFKRRPWEYVYIVREGWGREFRGARVLGSLSSL